MNIEDRVRILELRITTIETGLIELGHKDLLVNTMQKILKDVEKEMSQAETTQQEILNHQPCDLEPGIGGEIARDKVNE